MRCFYSVEHSNTPLTQVQLEETRCGSDHLLSKAPFSDTSTETKTKIDTF